MSEKNYFRIVSPKCDTILHSATPASAAAKAYSRCFSKRVKNSRKSKVVSIQRRSGNKKVMSYRIKAVKNPKKMLVERDGNVIRFDYHTKVKSLNKSRK